MAAKTDAERQRASRDARAAAGLKRIDVWCSPEDEAAIREFAAKLQRRRVKNSHSQAPRD